MSASTLKATGPTAADFLIIGGGIAGASAAYELAQLGTVIVLERESQCGYHSTGRSAASFTENYGGTVIRRLAIASRAFLESPPPGFSAHPLLSPRGLITIAREDQLELLSEQYQRARALVETIVTMDVEDAIARVPILRREYVAGAFFEPHSRDIDVDGLHQGFLRGARQRGALTIVNAAVEALEHAGDGWRVSASAGEFSAPIIVNAAGAWADAVAALAGVRPLGLTPKRRTAFTIPPPEGVETRRWPMIDDVAETLYFKPDAGQLLVSPADATPCLPMDVYADDLDVAMGVERFELATTLSVNRVSRTWAGLRTFASDGGPVVGFDGSEQGFFWLAGQGGYGIKTSPALARACAGLIRDGRLPQELASLGITAGELSPVRLLRGEDPAGDGSS